MNVRFPGLWGLALLYCPQLLGQCDGNVPTFIVDLSSSPNATYQSPSIQREGLCCGATPPDECIQFIVTLHPQAQGINFEICDGAIPPGAMFYQVGCGQPSAVGTAMCLNGPGPHVITFCKPGNNTNQYCILSLPGPVAGPDVQVGFGCAAGISAFGFDPSTTQWTSVYPGVIGDWDALLACPTCTTTSVASAPTAPPEVRYRICGNAISPCSTMVFCDTVSVFFLDEMSVSVTPAEPTQCFGAATTTITAIPAGGSPPYTYQWSTGANTPSIEVGPGDYAVELYDQTGCGPVKAFVTVTAFADEITANAGADIVHCDPASPVQLGGSVVTASGGAWSGGGGVFMPSSNALNATYLPTAAEVAAGGVDLTLTTTGNGSCPAATDAVHLALSPGFPGAAIMVTHATCAGTATGSAVVAPTLPGWSFQWDDPMMQTAAIASGLVAGPYAVTVTDALGCSATLITVVAEPLPLQVTTVVTDETCAGLANGTATAIASGGSGPYSYSWTTGATTSGFTAGAGSYTVSVVDANGCGPVSTTAVIQASAQPASADAGPDVAVCSSVGAIALTGTYVNAFGGSWSGGGGIFTGNGVSVTYAPGAADLAAGSTTLTFTAAGDPNCPIAADQVTIVIHNALFGASVSSTDIACHGAGNGTATFSPYGVQFQYQWNDPMLQTTPTATGLPPGTWSVHVVDQNGCDTTLSVMIDEPPPLVINAAVGLPPHCADADDGQVALTVIGGATPYDVAWSANAGGQTGVTISGLAGGTYTATITDQNGCSVDTSITLVQPPPILLTATIPDTACANVPIQLTASAAGGSGSLTIQWPGLGTGSTLTTVLTGPTTVSVTVVDANGCPGPAIEENVFVIDLAGTTFTTSNDTAFCLGGIALLSAELLDASPGMNLYWPQLNTYGGGPFTVAPSTSQNYVVQWLNSCGLPLSDTIVVQVEAPPVISLPPVIAEGCAQLTVQFPDGLASQPLTYSWDLGDGTTSNESSPVHTYPEGIYTVALSFSTPLGCAGQAGNTGQVIVHPSPTAAFSQSLTETDIDAPEVQFTSGSSADVVTHDWHFGDGDSSSAISPAHTYEDTGHFQVHLIVVNAFGCTDEAVSQVFVAPTHYIELPNTFTPNLDHGNGGAWSLGNFSNDVFFAFTEYVEEFEMRIWNRWGELVFESHDVKVGWDGWYRGEPSPQDVYAYRVKARFSDDHWEDVLGNVTLIR